MNSSPVYFCNYVCGCRNKTFFEYTTTERCQSHIAGNGESDFGLWLVQSESLKEEHRVIARKELGASGATKIFQLIWAIVGNSFEPGATILSCGFFDGTFDKFAFYPPMTLSISSLTFFNRSNVTASLGGVSLSRTVIAWIRSEGDSNSSRIEGHIPTVVVQYYDEIIKGYFESRALGSFNETNGKED